MTSIREPGKLDDNTTLIDIGMQKVRGITAAYLVEGDKTCLIDSGTWDCAPRLVRTLKTLDAFPPDMVIVTHSHWDHTQGIPLLREGAAKLGRQIQVLASPQAIPLLADQSYNSVFGHGQFENITDVTPLAEGASIDLGRVTLRTFGLPGHHKDHIAILDESNGNVFVGDALGYKFGDRAFVPSFMPPFWDPDAYRASVEKLRQVGYKSLCLAHFGFFDGDEARDILDESVATCEQWWRIFEENEHLLDDPARLAEVVLERTGFTMPPVRAVSPVVGVAMALVTAWNRLIHGGSWSTGKLLLQETIAWLVRGYRTYQGQQPR